MMTLQFINNNAAKVQNCNQICNSKDQIMANYIDKQALFYKLNAHLT